MLTIAHIATHTFPLGSILITIAGIGLLNARIKQ